jgi:hypothetical protein
MGGERESVQSEHLQSCELELMLKVRAGTAYEAHMRFFRPGDDSEIRICLPDPVLIDRQRLGELKRNPIEYGAALWSMLFKEPKAQQVYERANVNARSRGMALRLRLFISGDAPELHSIWWETLLDPATGTPLLMREDFIFSRYLDSSDERPVEQEAAHDLRILCAIADPSDIGEYQVDNRTLAGPGLDEKCLLGGENGGRLDVEMLGNGAHVTLSRLIDRVRQGVDILYLVCHGALVERRPQLYLEDESGRTAVVAGEDLAASLRDMLNRPRLIVLASCQSGGTGAETTVGDDGVLAALGPRLMDAGVPAVLAMQGNVTMTTVVRFMPVLFQQLAAHGQIDRAMAVARGELRDRHDWWMPVLFMRLRSGALWNWPAPASTPVPGYQWEGLLGDLQDRTTVMVLGTGLGEAVLGSTRDIARSWAEEYQFPLALQMRDDLPQVAQYLAYTRNPSFPLSQLRRHLLHDLRQRHAALLREFSVPIEQSDALDVLVREIGSRLRALDEPDGSSAVADGADAMDAVREMAGRQEPAAAASREDGAAAQAAAPSAHFPYTQLARLPVCMYVTANRDNLLFDSLTAENRHPEVLVCRWKPLLADNQAEDRQQWPPSVFDREPNYKPSLQRTLIYHDFGKTSYPDTVVLTEED